ncbi:Zinc finger matrin-type protein 2 [Operophtera brumata]|uniref:Zinc finger matrin-type protein 2 n=1 Tax=Operophtera brumata TaxID=104452 RepID=A0A0L7LRZ3_OPEBR|nr:Zinc finger matrin-type protein 2 [Operophtera brumata]
MSLRPDDHRRKWDKDEFEKIAAERLQAELDEDEKSKKKAVPVKRELLKQRDYKVDLDSKLGKSIVINKNTPTAQSGGYYCNVCDCVVKDSINFLDHINGKKHQRNLGIRLREAAEEEARVKELRRERRRDKKRKLNDDDTEETPGPAQNELAEIMGFSGFGASKK